MEQLDDEEAERALAKVNIPFSDEQVIKLNEFQKKGFFHPFTCDRHADECEVKIKPRDYSKDGVLIASNDGWTCPCGKYTQDWAHNFMGT